MERPTPGMHRNAVNPQLGSGVASLVLVDAPPQQTHATVRDDPQPSMRIALLIDRLNVGGAERQFVVLAKGLTRAGHAVTAMVFYANGALEADLREAGVTLRVLDKRGRWDVVRFVVHLLRVLRQERPQVLHGYSGVPNMFASLLKPFLPGVKVVWGVRASNMQLQRYGWLPRLLNPLSLVLAQSADLVVANSFAGLDHANSSGYPRDRGVVIPNGIDTNRFAPSQEARERFRRGWGISSDERLIGLVGRIDPMKDHPTFLKAAALLARDRHDLRVVCVGDGPTDYLRELQGLASQLGLDDRLQWVPSQTHMTDVYNGLDVLCSSSLYGEGFPNVLGEAMACGTPCVVTEVGDSARILAQPRFTVPASNPRALADAVSLLLSRPADETAEMVATGRQRIADHFSIAHLVNATEDALASLLGRSTR
jgi:glycosyltransferase involved in cell wall biosynthesis